MGQGSDHGSPGRPDSAACRKWLCRVGYLTKVSIYILLALVCLAFAYGWLESRKSKAALMDMSRTHEGPLAPQPESLLRGRAIELLRLLPPLQSLHGNGLRLIAMPSFVEKEYGVVLYRNYGSQAEGVLVVVDRLKPNTSVRSHRFVLSAEEYSHLTNEMDRLTDGWPGSSVMWLDGVPVAFERVRDARITSGMGNGEHYGSLWWLVYGTIRPNVPDEFFPVEVGWR